MSRIRANQITNQSADGAPTVQNGLVISGVTTSTTFSGSGASLTNIPDSALSSVTASKLTGALPAISGANLTNLDASDLASGTVPTARLGSGTANSSTFLAGDSTFKTVTGTTINNNADNRVITGSGTANTLEGESQLLFTGTNLGVGNRTSSPDERLHVHTSSGQANIHVEGATDGQIILRSHGGDSVIHFGDASATSVGKIQYDHGTDSLQFNTNSSQRLRITSDGHTLFSGLTTKNDPRNTNGITLKSTAGVSFQNYGSNGSRNWRIRPDDQSRWGDLDFSVSPTANSATDWPDAASDKVLTLGYDGQVSKPRQASFAAMKSGNAYSLNNQVFPFDTTTHNIGSHFNTSNYRFTAPVAGRYLFTFYSILNSSGQGRYEILINGAANQNGTRVHMTPNTTNWDHVSTSWILNLAANDYIQMYSQSNTGWHGNHWQRFCGELLS